MKSLPLISFLFFAAALYAFVMTRPAGYFPGEISTNPIASILEGRR